MIREKQDIKSRTLGIEQQQQQKQEEETMPSRLSTPVLTVDPAKIHQVDTRNAESLHGMWMGE